MDEITSPSFLFPSDQAEVQDNPLAFLTDKLTLKDIVSGLCKQLHHPVALIDYNALMKTATPEKLESMVEMYPMRRSCSVLRKCAGDIYCTQCDRFHARCMDIDKAAIETKIQESLEQVPAFFYPEYENSLPKVLDGFDRPVVEYRCPMLGYRELLFPLKYKERIFGVFFAGQIMVWAEGDQEINKMISTSFFKKNSLEALFKPFVDGYNAQAKENAKLDYKKIKNLIVDSDYIARLYDAVLGFKQETNNDSEYFSKNFETDGEYEAFIRNVCHAIAETEDRISGIYEERRKKTVSKTLREFSDRYFEEYRKVHSRRFKNRHEARAEELKSAWVALEFFAREILQQFEPVEGIILFGDRQGIKIENSSRKEIVFTVPPVERNPKGSLNVSLYGIDGISGYGNSLTDPAILAGLSKEFPKDNCILIQCRDIAMLMLVQELDAHKELYASLTDAVGKELVQINSIIALCSANLMKEKYLLTLRMYRHENAHISTRLMGNINRYFKNGGVRFLRADEEKRQLVCNDMKNTVQLISNIADNIGFVTGTGIAAEDPQKDAVCFDVVDMLYKWQTMFQDELEVRNLEILVYRGGYDSATIGYKIEGALLKGVSEITRQNGRYLAAPKEIEINARLFELLVYNLVDNAVKYAYRGTNIYLIWSRWENYYELSVTSYGPRMPNGDEMYGLYVRGNDERILQGDGLGLYVVKKIAEKLVLNISHSSERISRYNVPLIPWYIRTNFSEIKGYSKIEADKLTRNNNAAQVDLATNKYPPTEIKENDLTPSYLSKRIRMETWRTTFRVRIPVKNK